MPQEIVNGIKTREVLYRSNLGDLYTRLYIDSHYFIILKCKVKDEDKVSTRSCVDYTICKF